MNGCQITQRNATNTREWQRAPAILVNQTHNHYSHTDWVWQTDRQTDRQRDDRLEAESL